MSEVMFKQTGPISIVREYENRGNNNSDRWQPFSETIFYVKEERKFELELYFVNSDLIPRMPGSYSYGYAVLAARLLLQTNVGEIELGGSPVFTLSSDSPLKTFQISGTCQLVPGVYLLAAQINLKGSESYTGALNGMKFEAQNSYLAIAKV